jgi:hypothetical protein
MLTTPLEDVVPSPLEKTKLPPEWMVLRPENI